MEPLFTLLETTRSLAEEGCVGTFGELDSFALLFVMAHKEKSQGLIAVLKQHLFCKRIPAKTIPSLARGHAVEILLINKVTEMLFQSGLYLDYTSRKIRF